MKKQRNNHSILKITLLSFTLLAYGAERDEVKYTRGKMRKKTTYLISLIFLSISVLILKFNLLPVNAAPLATSDPYDDDFSSTNLRSTWYWVREKPTHWSLSANPGYMRIITTRTDLYEDDNSAPVLLQAFSGDSFEIQTKLSAKKNYKELWAKWRNRK